MVLLGCQQIQPRPANLPHSHEYLEQLPAGKAGRLLTATLGLSWWSELGADISDLLFCLSSACLQGHQPEVMRT